MEDNIAAATISEKERVMKDMNLNSAKVTNITLSNSNKRKELWDKWIEDHPTSNKTWRVAKSKNVNTKRCQIPVVIKEVSTTVMIKITDAIDDRNDEDEEAPIDITTLSIQSAK